jgi:hypothetical protein
MEHQALKRFKQISGVPYTVKPFDNSFDVSAPELFVVSIKKHFRPSIRLAS